MGKGNCHRNGIDAVVIAVPESNVRGSGEIGLSAANPSKAVWIDEPVKGDSQPECIARMQTCAIRASVHQENDVAPHL